MREEDERLSAEDAAHQVPVPLLRELRIEAALVPNRRGELYRLAADEIERLTRGCEWLTGLIDKLPTLDPTWPENIQALWWERFEALRARIPDVSSEGGSPRAPCSRCGLLRYPSCPTEGCPLREGHHQSHSEKT